MKFPEVFLRDYQQRIRQRVLDAWACHTSVMVQMPTGTGKTHVLASVIYDRLTVKPDECVWIVAHRRELVEQIEETVARYGLRKGMGKVEVKSIQWLSQQGNDRTGERPGLIVVDEAHHALAETYRELWLRYPDARKLGMTATPCRLNGKGFGDLFEVLIASDGIADFIRLGWLAAFDYVAIRRDSEEQRLIGGLSKRGADGDFQLKEMNEVLNCRPGIERLFDSYAYYAYGKKGIVYTVGIDHARNVADYYTAMGVNAVAIDSRTPPRVRKQMVEDFRMGKIQVLVNVDVFSEGFDCPDVEFVQLARPTLSLAKYLQQVGRGLRKSEGKEACVLIDNVGLCRLFGLPVVERDWEAMFEGRLPGKGHMEKAGQTACMAVARVPGEDAGRDGPLEVVMLHGQLMECLCGGKPFADIGGHLPEVLKAFKDRTSGLYGLKRGNKITAAPQYVEVFGVDDERVAVRFADGGMGIVLEDGSVEMVLGQGRKMRFLKDKIVAVTDVGGKDTFVDLRNGKCYGHRPKVLDFGNVQMLEVAGTGYSRTRNLYKTKGGTGLRDVFGYGYFLRVCDFLSQPRCKQVDEEEALWGYDSVCLFADDYETYYRFCGFLADGSIVVEDGKGNYYLASEGREKQYIACEQPATEEEDFDRVVPLLKAKAEVRAAEKKEKLRREKENRRQERLAAMRQAEPFKAGLKWGLKWGGKVVVPPIYRNVQAPVGNYCAVEDNPRQWGIITLDGKVVVEARYMKVEIYDNGIACLTVLPGKTKTVDLNGI